MRSRVSHHLPIICYPPRVPLFLFNNAWDMPVSYPLIMSPETNCPLISLGKYLNHKENIPLNRVS